MFRNILFVCVGNICRSPTAEALMRHRLGRDDIAVASAGLQALVGRPIDATAGLLLREHGLDADAHRARQATASLLTGADLVLVMERRHLLDIGRDVPQASGKVFLLGKWRDGREIPDPYRQQRPAFEHAYRQIEDCVASWTPYLR